eukprot:Em0012g894a
MEEYPKAVLCQLCSQPYTDPRILPCLHSFCLQCLLREVERRSVNSFKMEQSQQNSGVVKPSQPGGSKEGSQDGGLEEGSQDGGSEEGSQDGGSEEGSQDGGLEEGSQDGGLEEGSQDGGLEEGSQDGGLEEGSQDGGLEEGSQDGGLEEGSQDGGLEEGSQDGGSEEEVKQDLKCPACEFHVSISKRGVELPQHLHLGFEAKVSQYQFKIARANEVPCDACFDGSSGPSVGFCCQCLQGLCQPCSEYHKRNRSLRCHTVITLGTEVTREQLIPDKLPAPSCSFHGNEKLNLYCATCECLICHECTTTDAHKDHTESIEIPHIEANSERDRIEKWITRVQEKNQELNTAVDVNKQVLQQVEASKEKAAEAIRQAFEKLHSILEEREKQLQSELHDLILCKTTSLGLQKEMFEKMSQDASHYLEFASKLLQNGSDHEVIAMKRLPSTQLEAIFNKANSEHLVPCEHSDITVSMETDSVVDEVFNFGKIIEFRPSPEESIWEPMSPAIVNTVYTLKVKARDSNGRKYPHGGVKIDVRAELRPIANDQLTSHGRSENHWDGTYTITLTPQTTGPHQLHITMDGQHIKNSPYDLQVRKSKLDYSAGLGNPQLHVSITSPLCIAIHKKSGDIFVGSEANCIDVYSKDGAQKTTIGSAGNSLCQFNRPCGLDIKGDELYVADSNNHRIQKLDLSGSFIHVCTFGRLGKGEGEFNHPSAIVVDFNDRLIVADQGNSRIQILTSKGSFLVSIDQSKSPSLDLSNIRGIALDVQGNIHVVKRYNNSGWISVFTPRGDFISKRQTVVKPTAIGIDVEGYELVCDEETRSLHVYDVTGHKCGAAVTHLQNPKGIVFDKGDLYIVQRQYSTTYLQRYSLQHSNTYVAK